MSTIAWWLTKHYKYGYSGKDRLKDLLSFCSGLLASGSLRKAIEKIRRVTNPCAYAHGEGEFPDSPTSVESFAEWDDEFGEEYADESLHDRALRESHEARDADYQ